MIPRLPFRVLYEISLDDNDYQLAESIESLEKEEINSTIQKTFAVKYFRVNYNHNKIRTRKFLTVQKWQKKNYSTMLTYPFLNL